MSAGCHLLMMKASLVGLVQETRRETDAGHKAGGRNVHMEMMLYFYKHVKSLL